METKLTFVISRQPDDVTCGPTCLKAVYAFYGDRIRFERVLSETRMLEEGGTLAVFLGCHALGRGYKATIYTYDLQAFDPTWFNGSQTDLRGRILAQAAAKDDPKLNRATEGYIEFLDRGGRLRFEDLSRQLIRGYLNRNIPIITGLSATWLHRTMREFGPKNDSDDVKGVPIGHFVALCGYDSTTKQILVADPISTNPYSDSNYYRVHIDRVINAILLGIVTHDANILIIHPQSYSGYAP